MNRSLKRFIKYCYWNSYNPVQTLVENDKLIKLLNGGLDYYPLLKSLHLYDKKNTFITYPHSSSIEHLIRRYLYA